MKAHCSHLVGIKCNRECECKSALESTKLHTNVKYFDALISPLICMSLFMQNYLVLLNRDARPQIQHDFFLFSHVLPFMSEGAQLTKNIREALN